MLKSDSRLPDHTPSQEREKGVQEEEDSDDDGQTMERGLNAPTGSEHTAAAAAAPQKTAQILALGLDKNQCRKGYAQNNLNNAQVWCPRL